MQQPSEGDAEPIEPGSGRVGTRLSEHADAHIDEVVGQVLGSESPALHGPGPEVLAQHVRRGHQPLEELLALGLAQVAGDAAAPPPLDGPGQRVVRLPLDGDEGPHGAHEVAAAGQLDLDHVRTELAQQAGAERRRNPGAHVDDADAVQRAAGRRANQP